MSGVKDRLSSTGDLPYVFIETQIPLFQKQNPHSFLIIDFRLIVISLGSVCPIASDTGSVAAKKLIM